MFCTSRKSRLGAKVGELHRPVDDYCRRRFGMILAAKEKYLHELQAKVVLIVSCVFVCLCSACTPCTNPRSTQSVSRSHHLVACMHVSNTHIRAYMLMHHLGRSKKARQRRQGQRQGRLLEGGNAIVRTAGNPAGWCLWSGSSERSYP